MDSETQSPSDDEPSSTGTGIGRPSERGPHA